LTRFSWHAMSDVKLHDSQIVGANCRRAFVKML